MMPSRLVLVGVIMVVGFRCGFALEPQKPVGPGANSGRWLLRGEALGLQGDRAGEIQAYEHALALDPASAESHFRLAVALDRSGIEGAPRRSYEHAKQAMRLDVRYRRRLLRALGRTAETRRMVQGTCVLPVEAASGSSAASGVRTRVGISSCPWTRDGSSTRSSPSP